MEPSKKENLKRFAEAEPPPLDPEMITGSPENTGRRLIRNLVIGLVALGVIVFSFGLVFLVMQSGPEASKKVETTYLPVVEVKEVVLENVPQMINAEGETSAKRQTRLAVEVGGRVRRVSPKFEVGEVIEAGEVLVELEDADYVSALAQAKSMHEEAKLAIIMEQAKAKQSLREWKQINGSREPGVLTKREPQIASAAARVEATQAAIAKAERDLDRTRIRAPYQCRIISKGVQLGAIAAPGAPVAEVISTGNIEVILPIQMKDLAWLSVKKGASESEPQGEVKVRAQWGGGLKTWTGKIIRSEGIVDRASRTLRVVVELDAEKNTQALPPVGLFVKAEIVGEALAQVVRLPRSAITESGHVWLVDDETKLRQLPVTIVRQLQNEVFLSEGLAEGTRVCLTIPSTPVVGMEVEIKDPVESAEAEESTAPLKETP